MNGERVLLNPKMSDHDNPIEPYTKDEERTRDPYQFDVDQNGAPLFTDKNIDFANGMVENDSNYNKTDLTELIGIYGGMFVDDDKERKLCIGRAVYEIDTHLTAISRYKVDKLMAELNAQPWRVKGMSDDDPEEEKTITGGALFTAELIYSIRNLEERLSAGDAKLVEEIAHAVDAKLQKRVKNNFSFATKFCHWVSYIVMKQDNFCIYDKVVAEVLPYYAEYYAMDRSIYRDWCRIKKGKSGSEIVSTVDRVKKLSDGYLQYRKLYDAVLVGANKWRADKHQKGNIGYREIDRVLWYYFKGARGKRSRKVLNAINMTD